MGKDRKPDFRETEVRFSICFHFCGMFFKASVILDNPNVGSHMQDHPILGIAMKAKDNKETIDKYNRFPYNLFSTLEWMNSKSNNYFNSKRIIFFDIFIKFIILFNLYLKKKFENKI